MIPKFTVFDSEIYGLLFRNLRCTLKSLYFCSTLTNWLPIRLLILNATFFVLAAIMDEIAIMIVFGSMLMAIASAYGVDPIHFGTIIVTNVAIGMASPPIGYCLFVGVAVSGLKLGQIAKSIWPFILCMIAVLMLVTYVPAFSLVLQP